MSARPCLALERVEVRRTPGIANRFVLENLCAGINLIYGPNASGKTTTALTIQSILWPKAPHWPRGSFRGHFQLDGDAWVVDFDAGTLSCQREGLDTSPIDAVAPDTRDRYVLTLPDLLKADNPAFAATILRESSGGYDLSAAVEGLDYRDSPRRPANKIEAVKRARGTVREARQAQDSLVVQQGQLAELRHRLDEARAAAECVRRLQAALDLRAAERRVADAADECDCYPAALERMTGTELETLTALRDEHQTARGRLEQAEAELAQAALTLERSGLAEHRPEPGLAKSLRARCLALQERASKVAAAGHELRETETRRDSARARIAPSLSDAQVRELDGRGLDELARLARALEEARVEQEAADALAAWTGAVEAPFNPDVVRDGLHWLNLWLRSPEANERDAARAARLTTIAAVIVIVEAIVLAVAVHWLFAVAGLAGAALILAARRGAPRGSGTAKLATTEYGKLGLEPPARWSVDEVERLATTLNTRLQHDILSLEKVQRWGDLAERRTTLATKKAQLAADVEALHQRYGVAPQDFASLALLASQIQNWQEADTQARQATAELEDARERHRAQLAEINAVLARYGYTAGADHATLLRFVDDLDQRISSADGAGETIERIEHELRGAIRPQIARRAEAVRSFFGSLGLTEGADDALRALTEQLDAYRAARAARADAEAERRQAARQIADPGEFAALSDVELRTELQRAETTAQELDVVQASITQIETRLEDAKRKHDLEVALADEANQLGTLREARDEESRLAAGWVLGEFVRERIRDRDRPRVFHRARELFARITQGRYRLEFEDRQPPSFRATDSTTGLSCGLDELSSATRIQLLIAVRVAFVEEMEHGPRLPLILDETLGNSDEQRARAIIEAAIAICRAGRQVFYFTAQHDEVGKWLGVLRDHPDVPHVAVNLSQVRELADFDRLPPLSILAPAFPIVPPPNGHGYDAYGRLLRVPGLDPRSDAGGIHLWYLEHDTDRLYGLLAKGITTWGQFKTLQELDGASLLPDGTACARIKARARLLVAAFDGWRIGRPPRVDRAVLIASGAISTSFLDAVAELSGSLDGNGVALVEALNANRVRRLQRAKIEQLETHLSAHGYLDAREPLLLGDLRVRAIAAVADELTAGRITLRDVDAALSRLPDMVMSESGVRA